MSDTVIRVENLSKKYLIKHQQDGQSYKTMRDVLSKGAKSLWQPFRGNKLEPFGKKCEEFWALKDLSFEIKQGDRVGIIGRNGAGKSTLLKILSRITEPTRGRVKIGGRIASLLEVGTGFHPELTGRENIFLNGAILGMSNSEISRKFDEIVHFSDVEKFLDTPVKRYSSGMYVRLAFSVAAHLESEILIVDEVLAVGDSQFQKKCLGQMGKVSQEGRTVLFVSHNMAAISQLCNKGLLLEQGKVKSSDEIDKVIKEYSNSESLATGFLKLDDFPGRKGCGDATFKWVKVLNSSEVITPEFSLGQDLNIRFEIGSSQTIENPRISIQIKTSEGFPICNMVDADSGFQVGKISGSGTYNITLKDIRLYPDVYSIGLWLGSADSHTTFDHVEDCISFQVIDGGKLTLRQLPRSSGLLFLTPTWDEVALC